MGSMTKPLSHRITLKQNLPRSLSCFIVTALAFCFSLRHETGLHTDITTFTIVSMATNRPFNLEFAS